MLTVPNLAPEEGASVVVFWVTKSFGGFSTIDASSDQFCSFCCVVPSTHGRRRHIAAYPQTLLDPSSKHKRDAPFVNGLWGTRLHFLFLSSKDIASCRFFKAMLVFSTI